MQGSIYGANFEINNRIMCFIENGVIYQTDPYGNGKSQIGVDNQTIETAIEKAEKYYNMLVENGIIQKPKTQEEINAELLKTIQMLHSEIQSLKGEKEVNDKPSIKNSSENTRDKRPNNKSGVASEQ